MGNSEGQLIYAALEKLEFDTLFRRSKALDVCKLRDCDLKT